jgi:hypothetical protein
MAIYGMLFREMSAKIGRRTDSNLLVFGAWRDVLDVNACQLRKGHGPSKACDGAATKKA